jgi:hypothetical protein
MLAHNARKEIIDSKGRKSPAVDGGASSRQDRQTVRCAP